MIMDSTAKILPLRSKNIFGATEANQTILGLRSYLCLIKFNYWCGKRHIQYFSRYFLNQIYIELCFQKMFLKRFIIYQTVHVFISKRKFRLIVQELGETIQNFINNLIVEAGHKLLCDDPTICGLIFTWNRFRNFV